MGVLPAFATALEKLASSGLEDAYARAHTRAGVADLRDSQKRTAYVKGAAFGAAGAGLLPGTMGIISYVQGADGRKAVVDQAHDLAKIKAYVVHRGWGGNDPEAAAREMSALMREGTRAKHIEPYVPILRGDLALSELKRGVASTEEDWSHHINDLATRNADVEAIVDELGAQPHMPDEAQWVRIREGLITALKPDPGMTDSEVAALRSAIEQHAGSSGVKFNAKALGNKMLKTEANKTALSMLPFALIGAMGGLAAIRMKRQKLESLQRDAQ